MGFYSRLIFPRVCDLALDNPWVAKRRREVLAPAAGEILEIGFGTGLNLACYPETVRKITTVDPNPGVQRRAERRIEQTGIEVVCHALSGERLPFEDESFDCLVSTFTLCSIADAEQALREVYRVLKPGGRFLFLEHGHSPDPGVARWQRRLNWLQGLIADGCRLDRQIRELISSQPFTEVEMKEEYIEKTPKTHGYAYQGVASK